MSNEISREELLKKIALLETEKSELQKENKALKQQVFIDSLTGFGNEDALFKQLESFSKSDIEKASTIVFSFDVSGVKAVNTISPLKHNAGAELIRCAAMAIKKSIGDNDVYRCGGDEFIIILRDCDMEKAGQILKNISTTLKKDWEIAGQMNGEENYHGVSAESIGIQGGVAIYNDPKVHRAEQKLYKQWLNEKGTPPNEKEAVQIMFKAMRSVADERMEEEKAKNPERRKFLEETALSLEKQGLHKEAAEHRERYNLTRVNLRQKDQDRNLK